MIVLLVCLSLITLPVMYLLLLVCSLPMVPMLAADGNCGSTTDGICVPVADGTWGSIADDPDPVVY